MELKIYTPSELEGILLEYIHTRGRDQADSTEKKSVRRPSYTEAFQRCITPAVVHSLVCQKLIITSPSAFLCCFLSNQPASKPAIFGPLYSLCNHFLFFLDTGKNMTASNSTRWLGPEWAKDHWITDQAIFHPPLRLKPDATSTNSNLMVMPLLLQRGLARGLRAEVDSCEESNISGIPIPAL